MTRKPTTIVYVDGFNLYYRALKGGPHRWLDLEAFADRLLPNNEVIQIRYFTARVKPRPDDPDAPTRQQAYLKALRSLPRVVVHEGQFLVSTTRMRVANPRANPKTVEVIKSEEKGSDVNIATYLMLDAFRNSAKAHVVISNDSDLMEPMRLVRMELNKIVGLVSPKDQHSHALLKCDPSFRLTVREHHLRDSQFPDEIQLANGQIARKPSGW
jgi:hypothetical protein